MFILGIVIAVIGMIGIIVTVRTATTAFFSLIFIAGFALLLFTIVGGPTP